MAPEHDARTRAFYDHESDEQSPRRRRAAADWGVNEDIFDRMPSRRFKRSDRRAEHRDEPEARRFERRVSGPSSDPRRDDEWDEIRARRDDWADEHERRQIAPRSGDWPADGDTAPRTAAGDEYAEAASRFAAEYAEPRSDDEYSARRGGDDGEPRGRARDEYAARRGGAGDEPGAPRDEYAEAASRFAAEYDDAPASRRAAADYDDAPAPRRAAVEHDDAPAPRERVSERRHARRPAESWTDDIPAVQPDEGKRPVDSWLEPDPGKELALAPGESLTVVLEKTADVAPPAAEDVPGRRTVTITGHPDRMPVPRTKRPPRSAIERIGASPDRIVGYAVLLGFVLVLIAVLTTGQ